MTVTGLNVYPVKSCRGVALTRAEVGRMGIRYDRRWMFVDEHGMFVAQRAGSEGVGVRSMCLIRTAIADGVLRLTAPDMPPLDLPLEGLPGEDLAVQVWQSHTRGIDQGEEADRWATAFMSRERPGRYRLVRMPDAGHRTAKIGESELAYGDAYPFLVLSEASVADLNARLLEPLPMNRFRPNIVLSGCAPYEEDRLDAIRIGDIELFGMTRCIRCPITTTDQDTAERGVEPLRTLATYRRTDGGVFFGRNFNHRGSGRLEIGDAVEVLQSATSRL